MRFADCFCRDACELPGARNGCSRTTFRSRDSGGKQGEISFSSENFGDVACAVTELRSGAGKLVGDGHKQVGQRNVITVMKV